MVDDLISITTKLRGPFSTGALAGLVATVPMTIFMLLMQRLLPKWQKYALPPEQITDEMAKRTDMKKNMDKQERVGTALLAHLGYGASMGVLYSRFSQRIPLPAALRGIVFGLIVWVGSYLGLLPALQMSEAAPEEPLRRNLLMIAAHVVWGASLGVTENFLAR